MMKAGALPVTLSAWLQAREEGRREHTNTPEKWLKKFADRPSNPPAASSPCPEADLDSKGGGGCMHWPSQLKNLRNDMFFSLSFCITWSRSIVILGWIRCEGTNLGCGKLKVLLRDVQAALAEGVHAGLGAHTLYRASG